MASDTYKTLADAEAYYLGNNPTLAAVLSDINVGGKRVETFAKIRIPSGVFGRLITLLINRLWKNPVQLDSVEAKSRLGKNFDKTSKDISTYAAVHGVCHGFWNVDHLEMFTARQYFPLMDERTGADMAGIRFWQIDEEKPWVVQLYELDGWTEWSRKDKGALTPVTAKQAYRLSVRSDALGSEIVAGDNYPGFPVLPMYANSQRMSELTPPIKGKIDLFDAILSSFGDTVLRTRIVYWVFENFSGDIASLTETKRLMEDLGIVARNDDSTAKAETIGIPYDATMKFLEELEKAIFRDAMMTNPQEIMGGNLTATAIKASYDAEDKKVSALEWQCTDFMDRLFTLIGIENKIITFKHATVQNDMEITQRLAMYSELDLETKLLKDPMFAEEEIPDILLRVARAQVGVDEDDVNA